MRPRCQEWPNLLRLEFATVPAFVSRRSLETILTGDRMAMLRRTVPRRRPIVLAGRGRQVASDHGEVVEWLKAPASKAGERDERSESSNLSLSAIRPRRGVNSPLAFVEAKR